MKDIRVTVFSNIGRKNLRMSYRDPGTGNPTTRSTGTTKRREAERIAAKWEAELQEGRYVGGADIRWRDFRERYEDEHLITLAEKTYSAACTALNHLERVIGPQTLGGLTATNLSRFQAKLRREGMKTTTLACHMRSIKAALGWAAIMEIIPQTPKIIMPKLAKGARLMKGRPITEAEFTRMLAAMTIVRPKDPAAWIKMLWSLWLGGLRLGEALALSWGEEADISIDLSGRHPRFRILAEGEKGRRDRLLPMTPDFAEFILKTPPTGRYGRVFQILNLRTGRPLQLRRTSEMISEIGKRAGVVVNKVEGKFASAHDLRRAFGTRWAPRVKPLTLKSLMRHSSISTTEKYYVDLDADELGDELWENHNSPPKR